MNFKDKTVVVTGGANGIGLSIVQEFLKAEAKVAVIDKSEKSIQCSMYFQGDIADENTLIKFADDVISKFGSVDYIINNACLNKGGLLSGCSYDDFLYIQRVGVAAPYMLAKLFMPYWGSNAAIVNISSTRSTMSQANTESYTAAKGGISALTHALAISLAGKVRVNSISPGWIDTTNGNFSHEDHTQHPTGRIGKPIDIAKTVLFLCSDDSGFITGENITIDGGMTKQMIYHADCGWNYHC